MVFPSHGIYLHCSVYLFCLWCGVPFTSAVGGSLPSHCGLALSNLSDALALQAGSSSNPFVSLGPLLGNANVGNCRHTGTGRTLRSKI